MVLGFRTAVGRPFRPSDGDIALALRFRLMPEYWLRYAIVTEQHQGIPTASVGMHPVGMTPIHLLPRILGADAKRLVTFQPAQLAAFESTQGDAVLKARILAQVIMALTPTGAKIPIHLNRGELIVQGSTLLFE